MTPWTRFSRPPVIPLPPISLHLNSGGNGNGSSLRRLLQTPQPTDSLKHLRRVCSSPGDSAHSSANPSVWRPSASPSAAALSRMPLATQAGKVDSVEEEKSPDNPVPEGAFAIAPNVNPTRPGVVTSLSHLLPLLLVLVIDTVPQSPRFWYIFQPTAGPWPTWP